MYGVTKIQYITEAYLLVTFTVSKLINESTAFVPAVLSALFICARNFVLHCVMVRVRVPYTATNPTVSAAYGVPQLYAYCVMMSLFMMSL